MGKENDELIRLRPRCVDPSGREMECDHPGERRPRAAVRALHDSGGPTLTDSFTGSKRASSDTTPRTRESRREARPSASLIERGRGRSWGHRRVTERDVTFWAQRIYVTAVALANRCGRRRVGQRRLGVFPRSRVVPSRAVARLAARCWRCARGVRSRRARSGVSTNWGPLQCDRASGGSRYMGGGGDPRGTGVV